MRVISGTAKGHSLKCIKGLDTRPTTDRVKESIFNIIAPFITNSKVLDLFSGTGNLAIESLSRGAEFSVLVESNPQCIKVINQNLEHTKLNDMTKVISGDVSQIKNINNKFDLIFMDPPYNRGYIIPTINIIFEYGLLDADGIIIIERSKHDIISDIPFEISREQVYGETIVTFLRHKKG